MIVETTFGTPKGYRKKKKSIVGKPLSLYDILKLKGVTSNCFYINESNLSINFLTTEKTVLDNANIEIRKEGIIVYINVKLQIYQWLIPYYQLSIYQNSDTFSIHAQGRYIQFSNENFTNTHYEFIKKLIHQKANYGSSFTFIDDYY